MTTLTYQYRLGSADLEKLESLVGFDLMLGANNGCVWPDRVEVQGLALWPRKAEPAPIVVLTTDWIITRSAGTAGTDHHEFCVAYSDEPLGNKVGRNAWPFAVWASTAADPVESVEIFEAEFTDFLADEAGSKSYHVFQYDKHIAFRQRSGASISLTTLHDSILGAIEIRFSSPPCYVDPTEEKIARRLQLTTVRP